MSARAASLTLGLVVAAALAPSAPCAAQALPAKVARDSIARMLTTSYGVPTSPAFALLPNQADEVTHIYTAADLSANAASWLQGGKLQTGAALDYRPGSAVGTLAQYRGSGLRQAIFRSILSAGTASAGEGSPDVMIGIGLRIPLIDRGDLRLDTVFEKALDDILIARLTQCGRPPSMTETAAEATARESANAQCGPAASDSVQALMRRTRAAKWNAVRVDIGLAGILELPNGIVDIDSVSAGQRGFWIGTSHPLGSKAQLNTIVKATMAPTDTATDERSRIVTGARLRWLAGTTAFSMEAALTDTRFEQKSLNDNWLHVAIVAEASLASFGELFKDQWIAIAYGGDRGRQMDPGSRLTLRYAVYKQRLLK